MGTAILAITILAMVCAGVLVNKWLVFRRLNRSFTSFAYEQKGYLLTPASFSNTMPELRLQLGEHAVNVHEVLRGGTDVRRSIAFILELEGGSKTLGALEIQSRVDGKVCDDENGRISFDDRDFDSALMVKSNNEGVARSLLTKDVRDALLAINEANPKGELVVTLTRHSLRVLKGYLPPTVTSIRSFFRLTSVLFRLVLNGLGYALPFSFNGEAPTEAVGEGQCPVCGGVLDDDLVRCAWCKTPHHAECWSYNQERCAIFGCKGRRHLLGDG